MSINDQTEGGRLRRALLAGDGEAIAGLGARLDGAGYETLRAEDADAAQTAVDEEPDVVLVLLGEEDEGAAEVALARRLRADERTFALPLALVYRQDATSLRLAALGVGADDYFALSTPTAELCARLDSLLWRAEAGRLVPPPEQQDEAASAAPAPPNASEAAPFEEEETGASAASAGEEVSATRGAPPVKTQGVESAEGAEGAEPARVFEDGRHVRAAPHATREARMIAALDASTERMSRAGARPAGLSASADNARRTGGPKRLLLIVSDAARLAQLNLLIRSAHYEVRTAFDARQALSLLRIERPDLLLVDYELKDMDGVEMLRRLREQQGGREGPPSLLLVPADRAEGLGGVAEARAVVTLPYNPEELLELIHAAGGAEQRGV